MKKIFYFLGFLLLSIHLSAQNVTAAEYFYNTDPGFGNGTPLTISTTNNTHTFTLPTNTSLSGFQNLYVRVKNSNNKWSFYEKIPLYIMPVPTNNVPEDIVSGEYFFNTDPGLGNGTAITISGAETSKNVSIPVPTNLSGFNVLYTRVKNTSNNWSFYKKSSFYIIPTSSTQISNIVAGEYFINSDPGEGNATPFSISGTNPTENISIALPQNLTGFQNIYFRVKNSDNVWSYYKRISLFISTVNNLSISELDGAEFFYDTDPGIGNATPVSLVSTGNADEYTVDLSTTNIPCGKHDFYLRLKNKNGKYSMYVLKKDVNIEDNVAPTVVTKNISVNLNASGTATVTAAMIDNGSTDNCSGISSKTLDKTTFSCANVGVNNVMLTVKDSAGNTATKTATVTVVDNILPIAKGKDITVQLNNGSVTITPQDVDNGSTDNCSITSMSLSKTTFTEAGIYNITFKVKDASGNSNETVVNVTVTNSTLATENNASKENKFEVYPVPVKDILNINSNVEVKEAQIFDLSGKLIKKMAVKNQKIDLSSLPNSSYIIIFNDISGGRFVKKIIKN